MSNEHNITLTINSIDGSPFQIPNSSLTMWSLKTSLGDKKTMSGKLSQMVGQEVTVEEYTNNSGKTYIRPLKDSSYGGGGNSGGNSGGGGQRNSGGGGNVVGIEVGHAITNAVNICTATGNMVTMEDIEAKAKQILALGDKMKAERAGDGAVATPPPAQDAPDNQPAWAQKSAIDICKQAGLVDRIVKAEMPESYIDEVYEAVGKDHSRLTAKINEELTKANF